MTRALFIGVALGCVIAPAYAFTEQDVADQLASDLAKALAPLHRVIPTQQLSLTASTNLAGDRAQLDLDLALKDLTSELAIASANLSSACRATAPAARRQYLADVAAAVARYEQAVAQAYNGWTRRSAEAFQGSQQSGPQTVQSAFQALTVVQQHAVQSMSQPEWGDGPPCIAPTLPDLSTPVNKDAERVAGVAYTIDQARISYLTDVYEAMAAYDRTAQAALTAADPQVMAETLRDALAELKEVACTRYQQYDAEVRSALGTLIQPCGQ
jgi:hypothetical protein